MAVTVNEVFCKKIIRLYRIKKTPELEIIITVLLNSYSEKFIAALFELDKEKPKFFLLHLKVDDIIKNSPIIIFNGNDTSEKKIIQLIKDYLFLENES